MCDFAYSTGIDGSLMVYFGKFTLPHLVMFYSYVELGFIAFS